MRTTQPARGGAGLASRLAHLTGGALFLSGALCVAQSAAAADSGSLGGLDAIYPALQALYIDLHKSPELSLQEEKTAARMAARLRDLGYEVTERIGGHGVVGVLRNGAGPTVALRTDFDGLPVKEQTGLAFASTATAKNSAGDMVPVMHACGHDVHMTAWIGAATLLASSKHEWKGTLLLIGQPAEEVVRGARAMVDDGLFTRFPKPDYVLGIHVSQALPAGQIGVVSGPASAASNTVEITFFGKGGHGAIPHQTIDPIVMASRAVVTLQTIVSREVDPLDSAVVSVGFFQAGTKHNIIPDEARLGLTVRAYKPEVQKKVLASIERIVKAEAMAAGASRDPAVVINEREGAEVVVNDPDLCARLTMALGRALGESNVVAAEPQMTSEDFGVYGRAAGAPSVQFRIGAIDPEVFADAKSRGRLLLLPGPHSPQFAPDYEPTIRTAVAAFVVSTRALLGSH